MANALIPLEQLQPSLAGIASSYFDKFPEILESSSDFLRRVVQCSGLALIQHILAAVQYQKTFGNTGICMLQVAKSLLCRPEQSISIVFGTAEIINWNSCQVTRWTFIFVVEARLQGRRLLCRREEDFSLLTFVDIPSFICAYLLSRL